MQNQKTNLIVEKTLSFSIEIIKFSEQLELLRKHVIAKQLLRSGTSIGANVWEAQNSESKADFIHKTKIAAKEADETSYWLKLCEISETYPYPKQVIIEELTQIIRIISKIISSSKVDSK